MSRPRILLTSDRAVVGDPPRLADFVNAVYTEAVERAGGLVTLLPAGDIHRVAEALTHADGVLLTGGPDYRRAGLDPHSRYCHTHREKRDLALWPLLAERYHAVLGICLGMQLMTLGAGGALYQDLPSQAPDAGLHRGTHHRVRLRPDSRLGRLLGNTILVNSRHHQALKQPGHGFVVAGWATDGLVEAIEAPGQRFLVGVQWHPEGMRRSAPQQRLFRAFVEASGNGGRWP
ncbi:gamma-glutamyl-gamma-aminobutyrate hydrolase family protein [Candidatus Fermentibacteria bacterium]|nr:gamma-glutamyl-gamma-aminobutyrate hydrolase family protein [Candidatus Fermentibacteria bacterium]